MAKVQAIRIGKTINKGNFESLRIDVELAASGARSLNVDEAVQDAYALIEHIANGGDPGKLKVAEAQRILDTRKRVAKYIGDE